MRTPAAPARLRGVGQTKPLRLWLELSLGDHVAGRVVDEAGGNHAFTGWLAFFALIDRLDTREANTQRSAVEPHRPTQPRASGERERPTEGS